MPLMTANDRALLLKRELQMAQHQIREAAIRLLQKSEKTRESFAIWLEEKIASQVQEILTRTEGYPFPLVAVQLDLGEKADEAIRENPKLEASVGRRILVETFAILAEEAGYDVFPILQENGSSMILSLDVAMLDEIEEEPAEAEPNEVPPEIANTEDAPAAPTA